MEEIIQVYFGTIIKAILEKEKDGQLCPQTLNKLKEDLDGLGF